MKLYEKQMTSLLILVAIVVLIFNIYQISTQTVPIGGYQQITETNQISIDTFLMELFSPFSLIVILVVIILIIAIFVIYKPSKPSKKPVKSAETAKPNKPGYKSRFR